MKTKEVVSASLVYHNRGWKRKAGWVSLKDLASYLKRPAPQVWRNFFYSPDWNLNYPIPSPTYQLVASRSGKIWRVQPDGQVVRIKRGKRKAPMALGKFAFGSQEKFISRLKTGDLLVPAVWADSIFRSLGGGHDEFSTFQNPVIKALDLALAV